MWLDGADGPLIKFLEIGFGGRFEADRQPHSRGIGYSAYELRKRGRVGFLAAPCNRRLTVTGGRIRRRR